MAPEAARCPVCAEPGQPFATARDLEYFTSDREYRYALCPACPVVFLIDPPPLSRLGEIYPQTYYSYGPEPSGLVFRVKDALDRRLFRRLLARLEGDRLKVLDVGGGAGTVLTSLRRASPRVAETHEVDFSAEAGAGAEDSGHVFHACAIEDFAHPGGFDLVLMLNLLEHVADPALVLRRVRSLLRPGGALLIKTPNFDTLDCRLFRHHEWGGFHCPRHFVLFSRASLLGLAAREGLKCEELRFTQGAPQWTASLLNLLYERGWIRLGPDRLQHRHPLHRPLLAATALLDFIRLPFAPTAQMIGTFRAVDLVEAD